MQSRAIYRGISFNIAEDSISSDIEGGGSSTTNLADIIKVEEQKGHYLLYLSSLLFIVVSKEAFENESDKTEFINRVKAKIVPEQEAKRSEKTIWIIAGVIFAIVAWLALSGNLTTKW
jgi:hypothetical protein